MDAIILAYGILTFVAYIVVQIIVLRFVHQDDAPRWVVKAYCITGAALVFLLCNKPSVAIPAFFVYSGLSAVYLVCIFSVIEASLTLRILSEVAAAKRGLPVHTLHIRYGPSHIVEKRISRFIRSRDLIYHAGSYSLTNNVTLFRLREIVSAVIRSIFPNK